MKSHTWASLVSAVPGLSALLCLYGVIENLPGRDWLVIATLALAVSVNMVCIAVILKYTRREAEKERRR